MAENSGDNDFTVEPPVRRVPTRVPEHSSAGIPGGSGDGTEPADGAESEVSVGKYAIALLLDRWRQRFHDLTPERFDQMLADLRAGIADRVVARGLMQEGLTPHLNPLSVRVYVGGVREALGLVDAQVRQAEVVDGATEEEIGPEEIEAAGPL